MNIRNKQDAATMDNTVELLRYTEANGDYTFTLKVNGTEIQFSDIEGMMGDNGRLNLVVSIPTSALRFTDG